jgi:hypothetical protein
VPGAIQVLQVPGYVVALYESNHAYRVVTLDGRLHIGENASQTQPARLLAMIFAKKGSTLTTPVQGRGGV